MHNIHTYTNAHTHTRTHKARMANKSTAYACSAVECLQRVILAIPILLIRSQQLCSFLLQIFLRPRLCCVCVFFKLKYAFLFSCFLVHSTVFEAFFSLFKLHFITLHPYSCLLPLMQRSSYCWFFFFFIHFIPISLTYRARIFVFYILWERFPFPFPAPDLIPHINLCEYKFAVCQQSVCLIRFLLLGYPKTLCPVLAMFSLDSRPRLLLRMSLAAVFLCVQLLAWLDFIRRERRCVFFIRFFSSVFGICNILRLFSRNKKNQPF